MRHHAATVLLVGLTWTVMRRVSAVYVVWVAMLRVEAQAVRSVWLGLRTWTWMRLHRATYVQLVALVIQTSLVLHVALGEQTWTLTHRRHAHCADLGRSQQEATRPARLSLIHI